jgi:hypothetical protein
MKKPNRYERQKINREKLIQKLSGTGLYTYRNNSHGTLMLPKPANDGRRHIGVNESFQGDSYFMDFVRRHELILVEDLSERNTMTEKLILDQPDQVKTSGAVEHVVQAQQPQQPAKPLNEVGVDPQKKDVLLTEDPLDGVEIILG